MSSSALTFTLFAFNLLHQRIPAAEITDTAAKLPTPAKTPVAADGMTAAGGITGAVSWAAPAKSWLRDGTADSGTNACPKAVTVTVCGARVTLMNSVAVAVGVSLPSLPDRTSISSLGQI